jgi:CDP-diacylglycerol--glycerol-3-phosphate 3-phosphatidyltransferase
LGVRLNWSEIKNKARLILSPLVKAFSFMSPNFVTFGGLLVVVIASVLIYNGKFRIGGVVLIIGSIFDAIDGQIAREKGKTSKFGAFFDSTLDRYAEFFIFFSIAFARKETLLLFLSSVAFLGAFMTSYTRARADSLGIDIKEGFFTRVERIIIIIIGLIFLPDHLTYVMAVLAIGANITAIQRILIAHKRLENGGK